MHRFTFIRHASTGATRRSIFARDEPLDARGRESATAVRVPVERGDVWCATSLRARETASLLGLVNLTSTTALDECDYGNWSGRALVEVMEEEPELLASWHRDPTSAPHGGESLIQVANRAHAWLQDRAASDGWTVAVTSSDVIATLIVNALGADLSAVWRLDLAPLHATMLHVRKGRVTVRGVNLPLAPRDHRELGPTASPLS